MKIAKWSSSEAYIWIIHWNELCCFWNCRWRTHPGLHLETKPGLPRPYGAWPSRPGCRGDSWERTPCWIWIANGPLTWLKQIYLKYHIKYHIAILPQNFRGRRNAFFIADHCRCHVATYTVGKYFCHRNVDFHTTVLKLQIISYMACTHILSTCHCKIISSKLATVPQTSKALVVGQSAALYALDHLVKGRVEEKLPLKRLVPYST